MASRAVARAKRLYELVELLSSRPWSVAELAEYFGASRRTVERDLEALKELGQAPVRVARGRYRLPPRSSPLNPVEALAVHAATRLLYHQTPAPNRHYVRALDKLAAMLPEPARTLTQESIRPLRKHGDDRPLELVARAWFERRYLRFEYRAADSKNWHRNELAVYFIEVNRQNLALYAIGHERTYHREVRTFKLTRMRNLHLLTDSYEIPEDFSPGAFLEGAWGLVGAHEHRVTVRLRFVPKAAPRVLENDYPGLEIEERLEDGSLIARLEVGADAEGFPIEILPWVQSWGPRVEVLEPENLRERWIEEARQLAERLATLADAKGG